MRKPSGRAGLWLAPFTLLLAAGLFAGQTKIWTQGDYGDFEKAVLKNISLRSDGLLTLAPRSHELFDTTSAYLWALAQDSKGNLYAGGGTTARLYRVPPDGKGKMPAYKGKLTDAQITDLVKYIRTLKK